MFAPTGAFLTIMEMQPLLLPGGNLSLSVAWGNFTTGFFLSFISLGILIYLVIKQGNPEKTLLIVWSVVILAATLGQRRFAYYLAVNVALLTGYLSWQILSLAGFKKLLAKPAEISERLKRERGKVKLKKSQKVGFRLTTRHVNMALAVIVVFFLVFFPNISPATNTAKQARFAPNDGWMDSLYWLKENTPDPFGDPDFYYKLHEPPPPEESYIPPESAYGVMSWWDYGYWIKRIAHRVPNTNPSQAVDLITNTARFFLSQDEDSADEIIQEMGSSYIIIDHMMVTGKFWAIITWAEREATDFFDTYHLPKEGKLVPVRLFYPEYYRSLVIRLYNFDGKAVTPENSVVISYEEKVNPSGELYKVVTDAQPFSSYEEAEAYISGQKSANYRIVGSNPFVSPVPLETLTYYKLIHSSDDSITQPGVGMLPSVKIFEYTE